MTSVAIIGADGAGKTTVARALESASPVPVKYVYMGANIESSNYSLPTSRLILAIKKRRFRSVAREKGITDPSFLSTHHQEHRQVKYGKAASTLRNINRLLEGWYRQAISWLFEMRGYVVVYDRHFLFDAAPPAGTHRRLSDRLYVWVLKHAYRRPDMVIFLDAPSDVLFARKGEGSLEYLDGRRAAFLAQGARERQFVRVDASQPLDCVLAEVGNHIAALGARRPGS